MVKVQHFASQELSCWPRLLQSVHFTRNFTSLRQRFQIQHNEGEPSPSVRTLFRAGLCAHSCSLHSLW